MITKLQKDLASRVRLRAHSFWTNLSPDGGGKPEGPLAEQIDRDFGGFDRFQAHMNEAANTVQGSGWACHGSRRPDASSSSRSTTTRATTAGH